MKKRYCSVVGGNPRVTSNFSCIQFHPFNYCNKPNQLAAFNAAIDLLSYNLVEVKSIPYVMIDHTGKNLKQTLANKKASRRIVNQPTLKDLKYEITRGYFSLLESKAYSLRLSDIKVISEASLRMTVYDYLRECFKPHSVRSLKEMEAVCETKNHSYINFAFNSLTNSLKRGQTCSVKSLVKLRNEPWVNCEGIFLGLWIRLARSLSKQIKKDGFKMQDVEIDLIAFFGEDREVCNRGVITKSMELFFKLFKEYKNIRLTSVFVEATSNTGKDYTISKVFSAQPDQDGLLVCSPNYDILQLKKIDQLPNQAKVKWSWNSINSKYGSKCTI